MKETKDSISLMKRMGDYPKNFLHETRDTFNNAPMVSINEVNAKSMIDRHSKDGYIIISPCRGGADFGLNTNNPMEKQKLAQINKERILNLIKQIKESGYSYTPVYGGFIENKGTPDEENVYERSFIVYNHDRKGNVGDFEKLKTMALKWCKEFNQDSVLVKEPGQPPRYLTKTGDVDMEFTGDTAFNDYAQEYFTDLHKNTHKYKDEDGRTPTRFSFTEAYINPQPQCLSEAHSRFLSNEVFLEYLS